MFNPENFFWRWCGHLLDLMVLSVFWFFASLPLVTIGAASTALYDAAVHGVRRGEAGGYRRFWRTFAAEFKTALPATLLFGALLAVVWAGYNLMGFLMARQPAAQAGLAAYAVLGLVLLGYLCWLFALLSRYEFRFAALCRTAWQFTILHLPRTAALALSLAGSIWFCLQFVAPLFFIPCMQALLAAMLIEPAFEKHAPAPDAPGDAPNGAGGE